MAAKRRKRAQKKTGYLNHGIYEAHGKRSISNRRKLRKRRKSGFGRWAVGKQESAGELAKRGKGDRSGPGIAGGNHEVREMDGRRMAHGQLDPRFQAPRSEKSGNSDDRHGQGTNQTMG